MLFYRTGTAHASDGGGTYIIIIISLLNFVDDSKHDRRCDDRVSIDPYEITTIIIIIILLYTKCFFFFFF